jgi:metal-responsive CopG/Arc/MetJ family transcriptional regulator
MSKQVVSFRFSNDELHTLDDACKRFGMNRTEVVNVAVRALIAEYIHQEGTLIKRTPWLLSSLTGDPNDQNRS